MKTINAIAICVLLAVPAFAVDGVVLINQSIALAGSVTPGDAPGFPVTISEPGSYQLSGNLVVPDANTTAIQITANNVTIDLNGFSIIGPVACTGFPVTCAPAGTGSGITGASFNGITIRHGVITGMGGDGILVGGSTRIEDVRALGNGAIGIIVGDASVSFSEASNNGGGGLVGEGAFISVTAIANAGHGMLISGAAGSIVMNGRFNSNNGDGILATVPVTLTGNAAYSNSQAGISACGAVTANSAAFNGGGDIINASGCTRANNYPAP